jgi:hypothetical protein
MEPRNVDLATIIETLRQRLGYFCLTPLYRHVVCLLLLWNKGIDEEKLLTLSLVERRCSKNVVAFCHGPVAQMDRATVS